jgi:hypothetical protein
LTHCLGKKKSDYVAKIMSRVKTVHSSNSMIETSMKIIKSTGFIDPAPIHQFYHNWFNLVDIADKYWYQVADYHGNRKWKSKMLYSIMCHFTLNVWCLSISKHPMLWKDFRKTLSTELIETYR